MKIYLGRHVYGLAALAFGAIAFVWHGFNGWQQIRALGNVSHPEILLYIAAVIQLYGAFRASGGKRRGLALSLWGPII